MRVLFLIIFLALAVTGCGLFPAASNTIPTAIPTGIVQVIVITNTPTVTPTPTLTLTPTLTQTSPTRTRTPQRVVAKPSATATPKTGAPPGASSLNGTTLESAIPIQDKTVINVPGSGRTFAVTGRRGLKIEAQSITSYTANVGAVTIKMYSPESLQQLKAALAGQASWPPNVGAMTYNNNRGEYNAYSGKTGSSEGFVTIFQNNSPQPASFTFSVKETAGACEGKVTGTYFEGFWWTTCDENWLRAFGVIH